MALSSAFLKRSSFKQTVFKQTIFNQTVRPLSLRKLRRLMNSKFFRFRFVPIAIVALIGACTQTSQPTESNASDPTATVNADNTVAVTGIPLPGQSLSDLATCDAAASQTEKVVCAADAFLATLSDEQQAEVLLDLTQENATRWSNLPTPFGKRNGIRLSTLNEEQLAAAQAVVYAAMGTAENDGYSEAMQIRMADDIAALFNDREEDGEEEDSGGGRPRGGGGVEFSSGAYFLAFLGTPSTTDTWMLQFGGHHLGINMTYSGGEVASATPLHTGVEPTDWTTEETSYAPLKGEHDGLVVMLASLSDEQRDAAQLSSTFTDVLLGPEQDGNFPEKKQGLAVSDLNSEQKALVLEAMKPWVQDADEMTADQLMAIYEQELDGTYIAFSGDPSLSNLADYARIDGPSVWIELANQPSDIVSVHYHTIWRDHARDYGAEFSF